MKVKAPLIASIFLLQGCVLAGIWRTPWPEPVEVHRVETADGWNLDIRRVLPSAKPYKPRPVVLVHGIVTNGRNFDIDEDTSLARALSARGFDVWIASLRGAGASEHRSDDFTFDDHAVFDAPAIVSYVREQTGQARVDWVGHSMGGLVLYAYLARGGTGIERAVTLGSPVAFGWTGRLEELVASVGKWSSVLRLPIVASAHSTMPLHGEWDGPAELLLMSRELTTGARWRKFIAIGVDDPPKGLLTQMAGWGARRQFDSLDHQTNYLEGLGDVQVPMLVVAGKVDAIAPPWNVRPAFERLGSPEKRWLVLGEANGMAGDYNHMDMLLSVHAQTDLYPRIAGWLEH